MDNKSLYSCIARGGVFKLLLIFTICTTFFSCENFMNGGELKKKIDEAVEYANAEPFNIRFSGDGGKISPSGIQSLKAGGSLNLLFNEDNDKCFINWQILENGKVLSDEEADKLINFSDKTNPETEIKILERREGLTIAANCEIRPVVLNYAPGYKAEGVFRDSLLKIIFSQSMAESSIYWTKDELDDLGITEDEYEIFEAKDFTDENENQYYYGYQEKLNQDNVVFKALTIFDRDNPNNNLLKFYDCPFYADSRCTVLNVPTKKSENAPPKLTEIEFNIQKSFKNAKGIELADRYLNFYFTNAAVDITPPKFDKFELYDGTNKFDSKADVRYELNGERIKELNKISKSPKFYVSGTVIDDDSHPSRLTVELERIDSQFYAYNKKTISRSVALASTGAISEFSKGDYCFDFSDETIADGIYNVRVVASDNNGNETVETFVSVYDFTPPKPVTINYTEGRDGRVILHYTTPSDMDYVYHTISYGNADNQTRYEYTENDKRNTVITNVKTDAQNGTTYYCYIRSVDGAGNTSDYVYVSEMGGARPGMICYAPGNVSSNLFCSKNYWPGKNPIGVVCDGSDPSKTMVWDLYEKTGYCWGKNGDPNSDTELKSYYSWDSTMGCTMNKASGLLWYTEVIKKKFSSMITYTHNGKNTIWYYLENVKNVNSPVTWYIPGPYEFKPLLDNYNAMKPAYDLLKNNGHNGLTLVTEKQVYWTGVPNFKDPNAYAGAFNIIITNSSGGGLKKIFENSSSELKYFACIPDVTWDNWYYKDLDYDDVGGTKYYLRTHAMAQIDMR